MMAVLNPLLEAFGLHMAQIVLNITFTITLLIGAYLASKGGRIYYLVFTTAIGAIICGILNQVLQIRLLLLISHAFLAIFFLAMTGFLLMKALKDETVTWEKICAALCVYLLFAYFWASTYTVIDYLKPKSFLNTPNGFPDLVYFSFVTITTVGYGDIVPLHPLTRALATLEAILGQFYLAVLVARLVGLHIVHSHSERT